MGESQKQRLGGVQMFETYFRQQGVSYCVGLGVQLENIIDAYQEVRIKMIRNVPADFTRDEWAYLIAFLEKKNLLKPFEQNFGQQISEAPFEYYFKIKPRVATWLPNNVSLLGPLTFTLLSLTGCKQKIKVGSHADNLLVKFIEYLRKHSTSEELLSYLEKDVKVHQFDRMNPLNQDFSKWADVRIVYGGDSAAASIDKMTHPINSMGVYFSNKKSEVWVEKDSITDSFCIDLIKVFSIYGQAGCTSPQKVCIVNGDSKDVLELKRKIFALWPDNVNALPAQHLASENILASQLAKIKGFEAQLLPQNSGVIYSGNPITEIISSAMSLGIEALSFDECIRSLPDNIQTIGVAFQKQETHQLLIRMLSETNIKRVVPVIQMHHFSNVWDGYNLFGQIFEQKELSYSQF